MASTAGVEFGFGVMRRLLRVGARRERMADMGFVAGRKGKSRTWAFKDVKSVGEPSASRPRKSHTQNTSEQEASSCEKLKGKKFTGSGTQD